MKISLHWLADFLPGAITGEAAADALTHGGLPVEVIEQRGDDTVIDVEVTSNRSDCLSHRGVGRELAALLDRPFNKPTAKATESNITASSIAKVRIDAAHLCPHYTARIIRGVKIGPSPAWMVKRLEAIGLRAVNNVVDVTNYVMFELGQPLHAFDFDRLDGSQIIVRQAAAGESLISIDGHERKLSADMLVIADAKKPVALAGVMGGRDSEVSDRTVNILLESARFEALSVRKTARQLSMKSDSSYRYERGIDPLLPVEASLRAAELILQTAGGELLSGYVEAGATGYAPRQLKLRASKLKSVLGIDLPPLLVTTALTRLGLNPVSAADEWSVTVPSARLDLNVEIDLVEEVARIVGYDKIPVRDEISIRLAPPEPDLQTNNEIRQDLVASGYFESVTVSFVTDSLAAPFTPKDCTLPRTHGAVRKVDANLRPSLLPGLLEALRRNETAGTIDARLFETGSVFWIDPAGKLIEQRRLAIVGGDVRDVRGAIESLLNSLNAAKKLLIAPTRQVGFGACGQIEWDGKVIGHVGVIEQAVCNTIGLRQAPSAAEIALEPLFAGAQHVPQLRPIPRFPAIRRDLSLVFPESVRYIQLQRLIDDLKLTDLQEIEYVTTYRGKPLEKTSKSVTVALVFRSATGTLTGEQADQAVQKVIEAAKKDLNATLRA